MIRGGTMAEDKVLTGEEATELEAAPPAKPQLDLTKYPVDIKLKNGETFFVTDEDAWLPTPLGIIATGAFERYETPKQVLIPQEAILYSELFFGDDLKLLLGSDD